MSYTTNNPNVLRKTADGDKEVKNILRRDTIGYTWKYRINFDWQPLEALYGFGSHMEDYMNLRGKELYLCQHNLKAMVPVLVSTNGLRFVVRCGLRDGIQRQFGRQLCGTGSSQGD